MQAIRIAVGDTQQQFAERMGWSISSVARYETCRTIQGVALLATERFATERGYNDMAELLRNSIRKDAGLDEALFERMVWDYQRKEEAAGR